MKIGQINPSYDNKTVEITFVDESNKYNPKSIKMRFQCFNEDSDCWEIFIERDKEYIDIPKDDNWKESSNG